MLGKILVISGSFYGFRAKQSAKSYLTSELRRLILVLHSVGLCKIKQIKSTVYIINKVKPLKHISDGSS